MIQTYRYMLDGQTVHLETPLARTPEPPTSAPETDTEEDPEAIALFRQLTAILALAVLALLLAPSAWRALSTLARAVSNWRYVALAREAQQFLDLLSYSESRETSGGLSWQVLSLSRSRSLAARELTLPALTARYVEFVRSASRHYNGKMVIAIDELDKIHDPEMVKALLVEVKGALFAKGCYYLISISEDATRAFRQRLSAGRDIFESTFDDVIELRQMDVQAASRMIERRLETSREPDRVPRECLPVLTLFGGGIPREIVRHLRRVALEDHRRAELASRAGVASYLLRIELEDWAAGLAEASVPGAEAVKLRDEATAALAALPEGAGNAAGWRKVRARLERCLEIIDPDRLRDRIAPWATAELKDEEPEEVRRWRAIVDDVQECLRLELLTVIGELIAHGSGEPWRRWESEILAAYRALLDQPALAERMIREIRDTALAEAA